MNDRTRQSHRRPEPRTTGRILREEPAGLATRRLALALVTGVMDDKRPLDHLLDQLSLQRGWTGLTPLDRAFVRALAATTLRRMGQIDDALRKLLDKPIPSKGLMVKRVLQLAAAQMLFMDVPDHAAVSLAVEQVDSDPVTRIWKGLTNGVLRNLARSRDDILAVQDPAKFAVPRWLRDRWVAQYGEEMVDRTSLMLLVEPYLDISVKSDPQGWAEKLGARVLPTGSLRLTLSGPVEHLTGFDEGQWWVQDAAAALPATLLGDVRGKRVADLCAAPGGKTAQLAHMGAEVTALDIASGRLERLKANMTRLDFLDVRTVQADLMTWAPKEPFDAVLLDAPCSATGTIRRHPDVMRLKSKEDVAELASVQANLLDRAHLWVKPGGTLIYCTCSLEPEEGEMQIARFLDRTKHFRRKKISPEELGDRAELVTRVGDMRAMPHDMKLDTDALSGLDGFFAARLVRLGE